MARCRKFSNKILSKYSWSIRGSSLMSAKPFNRNLLKINQRYCVSTWMIQSSWCLRRLSSRITLDNYHRKPTQKYRWGPEEVIWRIFIRSRNLRMEVSVVMLVHLITIKMLIFPNKSAMRVNKKTSIIFLSHQSQWKLRRKPHSLLCTAHPPETSKSTSQMKERMWMQEKSMSRWEI